MGLTQVEANEILTKHGPNALPEKSPPSPLKLFLSQLKSPLVYILLFAGIISFIFKEYADATVIGFAVFINTILGFLQEKKAENALLALKKLIHPQAKVIRDGKRTVINVENVVPGDTCIIDAGDKIPADGKIIYANRLFLTEAILTGESVAVSKDVKGDVYMGTVVTAGQGKFVVDKTGEETEIGKIAQSVQETFEDTPLRRQLVKFSKLLTYLVAILTAFVFIAGLVSGKEIFEIFETSIALAVSAIPEGLLVGMTVVLAIGMQRILKAKGLVRNLVSAETLGGVTTICLDKTGTLTEGKMQVTDVVGDETSIAKQLVIANDLDDPLVIASFEWASKKLSLKDVKGETVDNYLDKHTRLDSIPFSSKERFFASLNKVGPNTKVLFVNGAPEFLMEWSNLTKKEKEDIKKEIDKLTSEGKRVIGLCKKKVPFTKDYIKLDDVKKDLDWVGILGLSDPLRHGVKDALEKTKEAHVKLLVITGDYAQTAVSIVNQLGIKVEEKDIILGSELEKMSSDSLRSQLKDSDFKLFSRTTPQQKLKIVEALKQNGEIVAMMGDGVNDAPALKRADIGIVVGEASDVAKESADLVLLDSSFATIVAAIEEGRGLFANIRKIILYLMSDAFEEIVAVIVTIILGFPLPVTAVQILWINLVSDGFPHLALTVDPKEKGIMNEYPRDPKEPLVTNWMKELILIVSLWGGITALVLFLYFYLTTGHLVLAQSIAFATLGINSLVYVFSVRTLEKPFWTHDLFGNKWLNIAVLAGVFFQVLPFLHPFGRSFLGLSTLSFWHWMIIFLTSVFMFIMIEVAKHLLGNRFKRLKN